MHAVCPAHLIFLHLITITIQHLSFIAVLSTTAVKGCLGGCRFPCDKAAIFGKMMSDPVFGLSTNHEAHHHAVFASLLLLPPSWP